MKGVVTHVAGIMGLLVVTVVQSPASAAEIEWPIQSFHRNAVDVKVFSQSRSWVWPSNGTVWTLTDDDEKVMRFTCIDGEKLCYGAWVRGSDGRVYWGAGMDGKKACAKCCFICVDGRVKGHTLNP